MSSQSPPSSSLRQPVDVSGASFHTEDAWSWLQAALVAFVLIARLMIPTEAAVDGETLWIVAIVLAVGCLSLWMRPVALSGFVSMDRWNIFVFLLVAGHVVSALVLMVAHDGDRRAAVNMLWEWIGLGITFVLICKSTRSARDQRQLMHVLITAGVVLAGLGIWQHHVFYPQMSETYWESRRELDDYLARPISQSPIQATQYQQKVQELSRDIVDQGVPLEGAGRQLFESRLSASSEPFGMFALANTFAGLLMCIFLLLVALTGSGWSMLRERRQWVGSGVCVVVLAYCLLLTKSRTALAGALFGILVGATYLWRSGRMFGRKQVIWISAAVLLFTGVIGVAAMTGGLDRQVISESSKSLRYRLQYWTGAAGVIAESPVWGSGPGNFRQHYLKHKLPESSEEVADPHNWFLDVWCSGGLIGLSGLLGLISFALVSSPVLSEIESESRGQQGNWPTAKKGKRKTSKNQSSDVARVQARFVDKEARRSPWAWGAFGCLLALAASAELGFGFEDYRDSALWMFIVFSPLVYIVLFPMLRECRITHWHLKTVLAALLIHLLAAGGMEMPAITQLLLLLVALLAVNCRSELEVDLERKAVRERNIVTHVFQIAMPVALIVFLFTGLLPNWNRRQWIAAGNLANSPLQALANYGRAVNADSHSPEATSRLADAHFRVWQQTDKTTSLANDAFDQAVSYMQQSIERNPHSPFPHQRLGEWFVEKFKLSKASEDIERACRELTQAVKRYPNTALLRAQRAMAFELAGRIDDAVEEAEIAISLDEINRRENHQDKFLNDEILNKMLEIVRSRTEGVDYGIQN